MKAIDMQVTAIDFYNELLYRQLKAFDEKCKVAGLDMSPKDRQNITSDIIRKVVDLAVIENPDLDYNKGLEKLIEI